MRGDLMRAAFSAEFVDYRSYSRAYHGIPISKIHYLVHILSIGVRIVTASFGAHIIDTAVVVVA